MHGRRSLQPGCTPLIIIVCFTATGALGITSLVLLRENFNYYELQLNPIWSRLTDIQKAKGELSYEAEDAITHKLASMLVFMIIQALGIFTCIGVMLFTELVFGS